MPFDDHTITHDVLENETNGREVTTNNWSS